MIEIDLQNYPTGTEHKRRKPPIDRAAIRRKHRRAYWATKALLAKLQRQRKSR
jgi:hypothetical protein